MVLSAAYLKRNELVFTANKLHKLNTSEKDIENLTYHERCCLLYSNRVFVARHFQYRLQVFLKEIVVDDPLGKTKCYSIRVEFQVCGSPHVHCFLCVPNAPVLTSNTRKSMWLLLIKLFMHSCLTEMKIQNFMI